MTAVTETGRKEITGNLCMEVVKCTFTDGYTFTSKFGTVVAAFAQSRSRTGTYCGISGSTVTLNCASASGDVGDIFVIGY